MSLLIQLVINGLSIGSIFALGALGLSLIYKVSGFLDFSYPEVITLSAYLGVLYQGYLDSIYTWIPAVIITVISFNIIIEKLLWSKVKNIRNDSQTSLFIVSFALGMLIQAVIIFFAGGRPYNLPFPVLKDVEITGFLLPISGILGLSLGLTAVLLVYIFFEHTGTGLKLKAVSDNRFLAGISGINLQKAFYFKWAFAGFIASITGVVFGSTGLVSPNMSFNLFLPIFASLLIGNLTNQYLCFLGGFFVGLIQELSVILVPSDLKSGVSLIIILLIVSFRRGLKQ